MGLCSWSTRHKIQGLNKTISKKIAAKFSPFEPASHTTPRVGKSPEQSSVVPRGTLNWTPEKTQFLTFIHTPGFQTPHIFSLLLSV